LLKFGVLGRRPKSLFFLATLLGRLPTRVNLTSRGIYMDVVEACCVLCGEDREMEDHLFASYPLTWVVWSKIYSWFDSLF
jgi:hypothetical protein